MRVVDVKLGLRVSRNSSSSSFVRDRNTSQLKGRRIGRVVRMPVRTPGASTSTLVVQWEGTELTEEIAVHRVEPVPDTL